MATPLMRTALPEREVHYPESDGKPMAETDWHIQCMIEVREALRAFFRPVPDVYVAANMLMYYEEGNPRRSVAPDVYAVRGIPKHQRRIYKIWEEGRPPDFVLEITSDSTRREDLVTKRNLYERLGVGEYFLFDPLQDYLRPPLQGHRLVHGHYQRLEPTVGGGLLSATLGLELRLRNGALRIFDPQAQRWLPTPDELTAALDAQAAALETEAAARRQAEARAQAEAAARERAEAELVRLQAELARLRGQSRPE
jgi:Uma2 family endonuclease